MHLHAYLELTKDYHSRGAHKLLELPSNTVGERNYPNVQSVRNKARWLKYISKEDTDLLTHNIDVAAWLEAHTRKKATIGTYITQGQHPRDLLRRPEFAHYGDRYASL